MHKSFVAIRPVLGKDYPLEGPEAEHIIKSLRMKPGEKMILCDGEQNDYICEISSVLDKAVILTPVAVEYSAAEPDVAVTLYQCVPKGDKMGEIIKRAVELGVTTMIPVLSARCISRPDEKAASKTERYQKIALEAAKQSNRGAVPMVLAQIDFKELISKIKSHGQAFLLYECERDNPFAKQNFSKKDVAVIIGPEGGFSPEEAKLISQSGATSCTLGRRILRTETASACALSIIMANTNNM